MKCIRCEHDCKYRERKDRKCPKCGGKFAFEPREGDLLSDKAFQHAIQVVSAHGQVRWGVEHLYYEVCRRKRILRWLIIALIVVAIMLVLISVGAATALPGCFFGWVAASVLGLIAFGLSKNSPLVRVDSETFRKMYGRWVSVHGTPEGVITRKPQRKEPKQMEPDLADYSFDRAVICDRARTVDLLLANNFHFENNCAVLSVEGYPAGPFETVRTMLKRNPKLLVYALHDATPQGCTLAHRLATDATWFSGQVKVIDVGLRPSHGKHFKGMLISSKTPEVAAQDGITAWETVWLAQYILELAAIRPEQVLKRLFKAINAPINFADYPDDVIYLPSRHETGGGGSGGDGGAFTADAGDHDGPADSFG